MFETTFTCILESKEPYFPNRFESLAISGFFHRNKFFFRTKNFNNIFIDRFKEMKILLQNTENRLRKM